MYQSSFLKWAGGKTNALPHVMNVLPTTGKVWVEPFVGSATVALNTNFKKYFLNDNNADLIQTFQAVCADPKGFVADLTKLFTPENNTREAFTSLRGTFNSCTTPWERSLLFVYLNRHCYNGLMRYNNSGGFNTSFGAYKRPAVPTENLLHFANKFKNATFSVGCFSAMEITEPKSVIYCDPPYFAKSKTASFVGYTSDGFKLPEHTRLNDQALTWRNAGHKVFISNSDVPLVENYYRDKKSHTSFQVRRSISQIGSNRASAGEILMQY